MNFENSYATLDPRLYNKQTPSPLTNPRAGHFNPLIADQIGWSDDANLMDNWVSILSGITVPHGFEPLAMAYAGHQFGHWAGQLGDGRGLLMAQVRDKKGKLTDLHLKGIGLTPYSRMGDGRAVLRSTIREYLGGHAMTQLGIASSSALGFVVSDTTVYRERTESGAALMRVADCHIRLGHVQWIASFAPDLLPSFTDYMLDTYYPECRKTEQPILSFLTAVVKCTAVMIADWQLTGFAHGVMNTDNLSITGSTLDYGPFGFLERFNPAWINNHSDHSGRYSYQNQPAIGYWNLNVWLLNFLRFSTAGITRERLNDCLSHFEVGFSEHYQKGICNKLGLPYLANTLSQQQQATNQDSLSLAYEFLQLLEKNRLDYTNSFRALLAIITCKCKANLDNTQDLSYNRATQKHDQHLLHLLESELDADAKPSWQDWKTRYYEYLKTIYNIHSSSPQLNEFYTSITLLTGHNPIYIIRNAMAQRAITAGETGDFSEVQRLFTLLTTPYTLNTQSTAHPLDTLPPLPNTPEMLISCSS